MAQQQETDELRLAAEKLRLSRGYLKGHDLTKVSVVKQTFLGSKRQRKPASDQTAKVHKKLESMLTAIYVKCGPLMFVLCCVAFSTHTLYKFSTKDKMSEVIDGLEEWKSTDEWKSLSADCRGEDLIRNAFNNKEFAAALRKIDQEKAGRFTPVRDSPPVQQVETDSPPLQQIETDCWQFQQAREKCRPLQQASTDCQPLQQVSADYRPWQHFSTEYQPLQQASPRPVPILPANDPPIDHGPTNGGFWAQSVSSSPPWTGSASDGGLGTPETLGPGVNAVPAPIIRISDLTEAMQIACTFKTFNHRLELSPDGCSRLKITMEVDCTLDEARFLTQYRLPLPPSSL
ncbi:unnamed protein product [Clonostachys byssicola]|uniref:Uncharacterized protein n=1 Tax=Clonostachys byssicola TaxID=160290 RepID=A0A9N9UBK4_9HYPO|nr:unnamed protein product [Clonostachys byssicola]